MEWISVDDRLPKREGTYWCYVAETNSQRSGYFVDWSQLFIGRGVTHWMPLPNKPLK